MGSKGSKTTNVQQTSQTTSKPDPQAEELYRSILTRAGDVAQQPRTEYTGERVAGFTPDQLAAFQGIRDIQGASAPFLQQAQQFALQGGSPITGQQIAGYQDPYQQAVADAYERRSREMGERDVEALRSTAIKQGAYGGDRAALSEAALRAEQGMNRDKFIADLMSKGFSQSLAAAQADRTAAQTGATLEAGLGRAAQTLPLEAAGALGQVGAAQQQLEQQKLVIPYAEYLQQQAYPFESLTWLSQLAPAIGSQLGGTSSYAGTGATTTPGVSPLSTIIGGGLALGSLAIPGAGGVSALGNIGQFLGISDERAKENIEEVGRLKDGQKVYRYNYKGDPTTHIGLIAQEVEDKHPEAVGSFGGLKTVNYDAATRDAARRADGGGVGGETSEEPSGSKFLSDTMRMAQVMKSGLKSGFGVGGGVPHMAAGGIPGAGPAYVDYAGMKIPNIFPAVSIPMGRGAPAASAPPREPKPYTAPEFDFEKLKGFLMDVARAEQEEQKRRAKASVAEYESGGPGLPPPSYKYREPQPAIGGPMTTSEQLATRDYAGGGFVEPYDAGKGFAPVAFDDQMPPLDDDVADEGPRGPLTGLPALPIATKELPAPRMERAAAEPEKTAGFSLGPDVRAGLLAAGLKMMTTPGRAGEAIGLGGLQGIQTYGDFKKAEADLAKQKFEQDRLTRQLDWETTGRPAFERSMEAQRAESSRKLEEQRAESARKLAEYQAAQRMDVAMLPYKQMTPYQKAEIARYELQNAMQLKSPVVIGETSLGAKIYAMPKFNEETKQVDLHRIDPATGAVSPTPMSSVQPPAPPSPQAQAAESDAIASGKVPNNLPAEVRSMQPAGSPLARDESVLERVQKEDPKEGKQAANLIRGLANYEILTSSLPAHSGVRARLIALTKEYDPTWDYSTEAMRVKAVKDFGTGQQGNAVRSLNVAIDHMDTLRKITDALDRGDFNRWNELSTAFQRQFGATLPTDFDAATSIVGDEIVKAVMGTGGGALADREEIKRNLSSARSRQQMTSVLDTYTKLMAGQLDGLRRQYETTTGLKNFDRFVGDLARKRLAEVSHETPAAGTQTSKPKIGDVINGRRVVDTGVVPQFRADGKTPNPNAGKTAVKFEGSDKVEYY